MTNQKKLSLAPDARVPEEVAAPVVAVAKEEVACKYQGKVDPTMLDASDLNYTHKNSPAHIAWLKSKGLLKGL